jgi:ribosomal protein S18 acetylase RimI-like enzyme
MAGALASLRPSRSTSPAVLPLRPEDVPSLHLPAGRSNQAMREALTRYPGRSVWVPDTLEFALLGAWRHRPEIANLDELVAVRHLEPLLRRAFERCVERGDALMLAIELESDRRGSRFARAGLEMLEEVITYEIEIARAPRQSIPVLRLAPIGVGNASAIERLIEIDHAAFPWLWRNSTAEFEAYLRMPGVDVSFVERYGERIGYVGTTNFIGWGHLDRIAIDPALQGQGMGREALNLTIEAMRRRGASRAGLSTQRTNEASQRLYNRFGFVRTPSHDYQLNRAWCRGDLSGA